MTTAPTSKGEATRVRCLRAAVVLARTQGLRAVNGRTVGEVAKITPAAVYYHFGHLGDLRTETIKYAIANYANDDENSLRLLASMLAADNPLVARNGGGKITLDDVLKRLDTINRVATKR